MWLCYRRCAGKIGGHLPGWPEAHIVLVDHRGARSGVLRTSPLMYHEEGDAIAVVPSKAGQPTNPGWFHILKANPDTNCGTSFRGSPTADDPNIDL
jgi:deazaflavin-dependent oxidoreductase (nitroreductase family)